MEPKMSEVGGILTRAQKGWKDMAGAATPSTWLIPLFHSLTPPNVPHSNLLLLQFVDDELQCGFDVAVVAGTYHLLTHVGERLG